MIKMKVKVDIPKKAIVKKVGQATTKAQAILDQQVLKDSNYFIPMDTGELMRSSLRFSRIGEGLIIWNTPYARRLYYNPQFNFSKDVNPNARGLWFEAAKARHRHEWVKLVQILVAKNL